MQFALRVVEQVDKEEEEEEEAETEAEDEQLSEQQLRVRWEHKLHKFRATLENRLMKAARSEEAPPSLCIIWLNALWRVLRKDEQRGERGRGKVG